MAEIVISEFMDQPAVADLERDFDVFYDPALVDRPDALSRAVAPARALIVRNRTQVRGALLDAAGRLEVVGRLGVGLDNIDLAACAARGIEVRPATGANAVSVAEYVIAGILLLRRGAFTATAEVIAGRWPREALIGREVRGGRLGLIGFGATAREVASRARALGMTVASYDPFIGEDDPIWAAAGVAPSAFEPLIAEVEVLSLHVPLTAETRYLIDGDRLAAMRPGAFIINAARGGIVDERALADALRTGHVGGALLDVFEAEPLAADNAFTDVPNLILTPHIAGITAESQSAVSAVTARNVREALAGTA